MALTKASLVDLNANELILDLDADTSIRANTDDTVDIKIAGNVEVKMTATALAPGASDGNALGTAALEWSDLFLADGAVINFGDDQDVSLTHVADTGILLSSTDKLMFNDASQFIQGASATVLDIAATDEIELTATLIDVVGNLAVSGTIIGAGALTAATSITVGSAVLTEAELETLDGITVGTAIASKVVTTDANIDTSGQRNLTITAQLSAATLDISGDIDIDGTANLDVVDIDGATQIDAAVTIGVNDTGYDFKAFGDTSGANLHWDASEDDLSLSGAASLTVAGATTTAALTASGIIKTDDTTAATSTTDGSLQTDGGLSVAGDAIIGDDVTLISDAAVLSFGANAEVSLTHVHDTGLLLNSDNVIQFSDASQNIGASSGALRLNGNAEIELNATLVDINANVEISGTLTQTGIATFAAIPVFSAGINVSGGTIAGTLATAAQGNVTSLGTLTALTVDDVAVDGKVITMTGSSGDTFVTTVAANGATSLVTTDAAAAAAHLQITADGTVDIDSAGVLTLDSGAAINIEPASGSAILLDGTISIDAGVVTGATSITSTAFVGGLTGNVTGNASGTALTVTQAAQTAITSVGTLTSLTTSGVLDLTGTTDSSDATGDTGILRVEGGASIAKKLYVGTTASIGGALTIGGAVDAGSNSITTTGESLAANMTVSTAIRPDSSDSATIGTASREFADLYLADEAKIFFGDDQDVHIEHVHDAGLNIKNNNTGSDKPVIITLQSGETSLDDSGEEEIARIQFQAPDEEHGTDAILPVAFIKVRKQTNFSSSNNASMIQLGTSKSGNPVAQLEVGRAGTVRVMESEQDSTSILELNGGNITMADDASLSLTAIFNTGSLVGIGSRYNTDSGVVYVHGLYFGTYASGTPTILSDIGSDFANADTDGKMCFYGASGNATATVKNRLGLTNYVSISVLAMAGN